MKKFFMVTNLVTNLLQATPEVKNAVWSHGWGPRSAQEVYDHKHLYYQNCLVPQNTIYPVYEEAHLSNLRKTYLGQGKDICYLAEQCAIQNKKGSYFLYAISRGAAASIHFLATNQHQENLQAVVLESGPADILQTNNTKSLENFLGFRFPSWILTKIVHLISGKRFPLQPINTLEAIKNIKNKDLPILILHGQKDTLIEYDHAYKLYMAFKDAGFTSIYLHIDCAGKHCSTFLTPDSKQALNYFYKAYNIACKHNLPSDITTQDALTYLKAMHQPPVSSVQQAHHDLVTQQKNRILPSQQRNKRLGILAASLFASNLLYKKLLR